ncbi:MAG: helix-turn-helix domain-containing protein [Oscillospiraceae bacterium]|jgi:carbohydrate diacid regulator|nr:helix-turn-helix domain-containing protein [Oscillospiraceae bacterium]
MSNKLFQDYIRKITDTIGLKIGVVDETGSVVACSDLVMLGNVNEFVTLDMDESYEIFIRDGCTYKPFGHKERPEYAVFVEGTDEMAARYASLIAVTFNDMSKFYDDKNDRGKFIRNLVLDNVLPGDAVVRAREMQFSSDVSRVVLLIRIVTNGDVSPIEVIQNIFPDKRKDFVFTITENDIVLVKETKHNTTVKDLEELARSITDTLGGEFFTKVNVGVGTVVSGIREIGNSFKEAQQALEVGKVFDTDKSIVCYETLGIARLIYYLPEKLCETFLLEIFKKGSIEALDHETLFTIQRFFDNNLNVSETSRKLFVHRNTLVYRLEKIKKLTGLDLREFEHAIIFKIALMVRKSLTAKPMRF